jgi:small Trp-rich protein
MVSFRRGVNWVSTIDGNAPLEVCVDIIEPQLRLKGRMGFLLIGLLLLVMKMGEFGPVAHWSWVWVLLPFALAIVWWSFSDMIGLTQMRAMQKMDDRKVERRARAMEALGIDSRRERKVRKARDLARRVAQQMPEPPPPPPVSAESLREGAPPKPQPPRF